MLKEQNLFIDSIRTLANNEGIDAITLEKLYAHNDFSNELLDNYFDSDETLVKCILENEREKFEIIFIDHNFDGYFDAIDILFTVSKEMVGFPT